MKIEVTFIYFFFVFIFLPEFWFQEVPESIELVSRIFPLEMAAYGA